MNARTLRRVLTPPAIDFLPRETTLLAVIGFYTHLLGNVRRREAARKKRAEQRTDAATV